MQEVELKLLLAKEYAELLKQTINQLAGSESPQQNMLINRYFDTPTLALRQLEMGLRVRGCNGALEQTIKTAGSVVGGLHSRPEYNVDISSDTPQLALFPAEIWPQAADVAELQQALQCLFSTDFERTTWQVCLDNAAVEIAFDQGEISANGHRTPISEVEFELKQGDAAALLALAKAVANQVPLRLGKASKAQRGYRLAGQQAYQAPAAPDFTALTLASLLDGWQSLEEAIGYFAAEPAQTAQYWQWLSELIAQLPRVLKARALDEDIAGLSLWLLGEMQAEGELDAAAKLSLLQQDVHYGQLQLQLLTVLLAE